MPTAELSQPDDSPSIGGREPMKPIIIIAIASLAFLYIVVALLGFSQIYAPHPVYNQPLLTNTNENPTFEPYELQPLYSNVPCIPPHCTYKCQRDYVLPFHNIEEMNSELLSNQPSPLTCSSDHLANDNSTIWCTLMLLHVFASIEQSKTQI